MGEQPTPEIKPAEPPPGGVDAIEEQRHESRPVVPDPPDLGNSPAKDEAEELTEPDDTDGAASTDGATEPEKEAPA